jgi:glycosyltransferase involved in cell wall biosynthesis
MLYTNCDALMKVVMINDCAYVGETPLKGMPPQVKREHIKRTRSLLSKTFGLSHKILRAKGDLYHVHYLLQDCYITTRVGKKPSVGHAHGSDLRKSINHYMWGRLVRHNLRKCDKILVSTPDVLDIARQYREDAKYIPNPVDTELFYPKSNDKYCEKKRVIIASDCNFKVKGTDIAIKALSQLKKKVEVSIIKNGIDFERTCELASSLGLGLRVLPKVAHEKVNEYYWNADVVIDRFKLGSLGVVSLEAIACGRPVVTYISSEFQEYEDFPLKNVFTEKTVAEAVESADMSLWKNELKYFTKNHRTETILKDLFEIYGSLKH